MIHNTQEITGMSFSELSESSHRCRRFIAAAAALNLMVQLNQSLSTGTAAAAPFNGGLLQPNRRVMMEGVARSNSKMQINSPLDTFLVIVFIG